MPHLQEWRNATMKRPLKWSKAYFIKFFKESKENKPLSKMVTGVQQEKGGKKHENLHKFHNKRIHGQVI